MTEYSTPPTYQVPAEGSLTDDIVANAREHPDSVAISRKTADGWADLTAAQFLADVQSVARGLLARGIGPGDRVLLLSRTRYEWTLADYACWHVGAVTVPVYETASAEQVSWVLADSRPTLAFVETDDNAALVAQAAAAGAPPLPCVRLAAGGLDELRAAGAAIDDDALEARRAAVRPDDLATLIYTSGTTGRPKGCMLTHANFMFELGVATESLEALFARDDAATVLFLPLAHVFARIIQVGAIKKRVRLGHSGDIRELAADLASFQPTFILAVPRVFEKVYNSASSRAAADGRGRIFDSAVTVAIAHSQARDRSGPGPVLRARHAIFDRLVYRKLRAALGGKAAYAISGGAPLGERLAHFFRGVGVPVLEGYGLTETTAALTVNLPGDQRIGTVGRPLPGTSVAVADDGELLFRGGQVFQGYLHNPEATAEVIDADGWFHTGDVGEVDPDGFVRITGRKKEILVTAGGKNVAPAVLEDRVRAHPLVGQCLVVGDGRPFVAALVTIDAEAYAHWAAKRDKPDSVADAVADADVVAEIQRAVDDANAAVSRAEAIRKFAILPVDWTEETGELTPTLKLKRHVAVEAHRADIDALYR